VILLPDTHIDGAAEVAERVRKNVEAVVIPTEDETETRITVSIGVNSVIPDTAAPVSDFMEKADQALYKAKEQGRNRFVINEA
jgi:diguanylate cyclase (GGDEF)-like protein